MDCMSLGFTQQPDTQTLLILRLHGGKQQEIEKPLILQHFLNQSIIFIRIYTFSRIPNS